MQRGKRREEKEQRKKKIGKRRGNREERKKKRAKRREEKEERKKKRGKGREEKEEKKKKRGKRRQEKEQFMTNSAILGGLENLSKSLDLGHQRLVFSCNPREATIFRYFFLNFRTRFHPPTPTVWSM